jgi:predicted DNA-binding transcriptional regulator YafY
MTHRLERILKLVALLQSGAPFNALQLAQETNVHRRTVFRDVALLRSAGIPIRFDNDTSCYSIVGDVQFQADRLRPTELNQCLQMACLGNFLLHGNVEVIGKTVHKLAAGLPQTERAGVEQLLQHCSLPTQFEVNSAGDDQKVLVLVARAIRQQHQLLLMVNDGARENRPLRMSNPKLIFASRGFTLVGQSFPEGRTVELKLSAIREVSLLDAATESRRPDVLTAARLAPRDPPSTV